MWTHFDRVMCCVLLIGVPSFFMLWLAALTIFDHFYFIRFKKQLARERLNYRIVKHVHSVDARLMRHVGFNTHR